MDLGPLVLRSGATCGASGRVVLSPAGAVAEPLLPPSPLGGRAVADAGPHAVPVVGLDERRLQGRRRVGDRAEGVARLRGRWQDGRLHVLEEAAPDPPPGPGARAWTSPPGPVPPGGWPEGPEPHAPGVVDGLRDEGLVVQLTVFRPAVGGPVLVVAATDPSRVEQVLHPLLGDRVRAVRSRYAPADVTAVRQALARPPAAWAVTASGETSDAGGQLLLELDVVRVLPDLAAAARAWPPGLVRVRPWLAPG